MRRFLLSRWRQRCRFWNLLHISPRDRVVLIGAGKLGLLTAQVVHLVGADLTVIARRERQKVLLDRWHIPTADDFSPHSAQIVIDCTGSAEGFARALYLVEPRGTIILKSTYVGLPSADLTRIAVDEIRVVGSRCGSFEAALRLLQNGAVDVEALIDGCYSLSDGLAAFQQAAQKGVLKILLEMD